MKPDEASGELAPDDARVWAGVRVCNAGLEQPQEAT